MAKQKRTCIYYFPTKNGLITVCKKNRQDDYFCSEHANMDHKLCQLKIHFDDTSKVPTKNAETVYDNPSSFATVQCMNARVGFGNACDVHQEVLYPEAGKKQKSFKEVVQNMFNSDATKFKVTIFVEDPEPSTPPTVKRTVPKNLGPGEKV